MRTYSEFVSKALFFVSLVVFCVAYGVVAKKLEWFPSPQMRRAWNQAEFLLGIGSPASTWSRIYEREGVKISLPNKVQPGLTVAAFNYEAGVREPKIRLVDKKGNVLHSWSINRSAIFPKNERGLDRSEVHGSVMKKNGNIIFSTDYLGLVKMNSCGKVVWKSGKKTHHSVHEGRDGIFWVPGVYNREAKKVENEKYKHLSKSLKEDTILKFNKKGKIKKKIKLIEVLFKNGLDRAIAKARLLSHHDPTHLNDIEPLPSSLANEYPMFAAGDLLISMRNLDLVMVLDPDSLNVRWHAYKPFIGQHDPDFTGGGWIGVFDNNRDGTERGTMLGGSRIVSIRPHTDSMRVRFPTRYSDPFYTKIQGKWQDLENGNMLLAETRAGRVVEVDSNGRTVWELVEPGSSITKATRVDLTREQVASWPCSSVDSVDVSNANQ